MREKSAIIICALICATLIICAVLFWPTLYRYDKTQSKLVRINRITGYTEILSGSSWTHVSKIKPFNPNEYTTKVPAIPKEEISKIEISGVFDGKGHYNFRVYNGSEWIIKSMKLSIGLKDGNEKIFWKRIYETSIDIQPLSISSGSIKLMDYAPETNPYTDIVTDLIPDKSKIRVPEVRLEGALGYKNK
jgi:hypothetical protein